MTKPIVVKNCSKVFRIDHEKIITKITEQIPDKFLNGLSEIILICESVSFDHRMKYSIGKAGKPSKLEISIDCEDYNKYPFFSVFSLNIDFILKINEHIAKFLKPKSIDTEVLSHNKSKIQYRWMYLGIWSPIVYLLNIIVYPIRKTEYFREKIFRFADQIMDKASK